MSMIDLISVLDQIIDQKTVLPVFQPIVNIHQKNIHGYESLSRGPSNSPLHSALALFDVAERGNRLCELELLCRRLALAQFGEQNLPGKIFLNASPMTLMQTENHPDKTLQLLKAIGVAPERVVIELTERHPLDDYDIIRQATLHYREMGFQIAIDDLGAGYAGLRLWSELRPNYVKIDRHFVQGIHEDKVKQEFVRSILDIANGLDCKVIAEGIEIVEEFEVISDMDIEFGQGYYIARPMATPEKFVSQEMFSHRQRRQFLTRPARLSESVALLLRETPSVKPNARVEDAVDVFYSNKSLMTLAVVDEMQKPIGRVRRNIAMELFVNLYGRSLYGDKPISEFMENNAVVVDKSISVEQASKIITDNTRFEIEDDFIIVDDGKFVGIGKVVDLLKKITDLQIRNARYANPLTLLPGNVPIYELIDQLLEEEKVFTIAYCDLDNFKPFNDVYGYNQGDKVLRKVAEIFTDNVDPAQDFVGHVGGDDFILIFCSEDWQVRCEQILTVFSHEVLSFYSANDQTQGGILARDRQGQEQLFPVLSLSIGSTRPDLKRCQSHHDVAALASEAKRQAKLRKGNSLFLDRRSGPDTHDENVEDQIKRA
ncbi:MAG: GGDEF domain-containing protein [Gammaproteobacteria bacterium]|nr:GGDEF domain-containing protein [Gammaproteobacteria bacterium]